MHFPRLPLFSAVRRLQDRSRRRTCRCFAQVRQSVTLQHRRRREGTVLVALVALPLVDHKLLAFWNRVGLAQTSWHIESSSSRRHPLHVSPSKAACGSACLCCTKIFIIKSRPCLSTDSTVCTLALLLTASLLTRTAFCFSFDVSVSHLPDSPSRQRALLSLEYFKNRTSSSTSPRLAPALQSVNCNFSLTFCRLKNIRTPPLLHLPLHILGASRALASQGPGSSPSA